MTRTDNNELETVEVDADREISDDLDLKPDGSGSLTKYISSTLGAVIRDFDSKAESTTRSQDVLGHSLDRLTCGNYSKKNCVFR